MIDREELSAALVKQMKAMRACDSKEDAARWMSASYLLLERCLEALAAPIRSPLVAVARMPEIEVVQAMPDLRELERRRRALQEASNSRTVIYPEVVLPRGLKKPEAWTHADTLRLVRRNAEHHRKERLIQKLSR